jgi:hypothetical protein
MPIAVRTRMVFPLHKEETVELLTEVKISRSKAGGTREVFMGRFYLKLR